MPSGSEERLIPPLTIARSLDHEHVGVLAEALAELTQWFDGGTEELGQAEELIADAVRLAMKTGELTTARDLAKQAAEFAENSRSPIGRPTRFTAPDLLSTMHASCLPPLTGTMTLPGHC